MNKGKLLTPQEIEVWYILPPIRKEFAKILISRGLSQKQAAITLHLTEPAISQYLKDKRAKSVNFSAKVKQEMQASIDRILRDNNSSTLIGEFQKILPVIKHEMILCDMHKKLDSSIPANCTRCHKFWKRS